MPQKSDEKVDDDTPIRELYASSVSFGNGAPKLDASLAIGHTHETARLEIGSSLGQKDGQRIPSKIKGMPVKIVLSHEEAARLGLRMLEVVFGYDQSAQDFRDLTDSEKEERASVRAKLSEVAEIIESMRADFGFGVTHPMLVERKRSGEK